MNKHITTSMEELTTEGLNTELNEMPILSSLFRGLQKEGGG